MFVLLLSQLTAASVVPVVSFTRNAVVPALVNLVSGKSYIPILKEIRLYIFDDGEEVVDRCERKEGHIFACMGNNSLLIKRTATLHMCIMCTSFFSSVIFFVEQRIHKWHKLIESAS